MTKPDSVTGTITVLAAASTHVFKADRWSTDNRGRLDIISDDKTVAAFAAGAWGAVYKTCSAQP